MHGTEPTPSPRCNTREQQPPMTPDSWYEEASHGVERSIESARTNLQSYKVTMKRTFDQNRKETAVANGNYVYLRNDAKSDSLDPRYNGPFPVVHASPPNVTINIGDGRRRNVHLIRYKVNPPDTNVQRQTACRDCTQQDHSIVPLPEPDVDDTTNNTVRSPGRKLSSRELQEPPTMAGLSKSLSVTRKR